MGEWNKGSGKPSLFSLQDKLMGVFNPIYSVIFDNINFRGAPIIFETKY